MKLLYAFPAFLYCSFVLFVGLGIGFGGFAPLTWIYALGLLSAAVLLCMKKWWGCLPGVAVAVILGAVLLSQGELPTWGLLIGIYYAAMGLFCYKTR